MIANNNIEKNGQILMDYENELSVNTKDSDGEAPILIMSFGVIYLVKAFFVTLIVLVNGTFLIKSIRAYRKNHPDTSRYSPIMVMHYLNFAVVIMGFIFGVIVMIIPFLYFCIVFSNLG